MLETFSEQALSSSTVQEYRYKISSKNIEARKGIMGLHKLSFRFFLMSVSLTMT